MLEWSRHRPSSEDGSMQRRSLCAGGMPNSAAVKLASCIVVAHEGLQERDGCRFRC